MNIFDKNHIEFSGVKVGDCIFLVDYLYEKIESVIIQDIDIIDGQSRYCLVGYSGYFDKGKLFKTAQEAENRLNQWQILLSILDEKNDE